MIPLQHSSVRGTFVQGLTDGDIWRLDIFEGDQYSREKVRVRLLDKVGDEDGRGNVEGDEVDAETYIWVDDKEDLEKGEWDFAEFRRNKLHRWSDGNDEYGGRTRRCSLSPILNTCRPPKTDECPEVDEAVDAAGKDPTGGRGVNSSISNKLSAKESDEVLESAV